MKKSDAKTLSEFKDEHFGKKGTEKRDTLERTLNPNWIAI